MELYHFIDVVLKWWNCWQNEGLTEFVGDIK